MVILVIDTESGLADRCFHLNEVHALDVPWHFTGRPSEAESNSDITVYAVLYMHTNILTNK